MRFAPSVRVPPVRDKVLVAVAAAAEGEARLRFVTPTEPPEMLRLERLALPVPVLAELFRFMLNVPMVTMPPLMLAVACTGATVCAVDPPPIELLPNVIVPEMATVPPPMLSVAIEAPLVEAFELEFCPRRRVVKEADPVPPADIRLSVPVIVLLACKAPVRVPTLTVVATSVPVSKVKVPVRWPGVPEPAELPPMAKVVTSRLLSCPERTIELVEAKPVVALPDAIARLAAAEVSAPSSPLRRKLPVRTPASQPMKPPARFESVPAPTLKDGVLNTLATSPR